MVAPWLYGVFAASLAGWVGPPTLPPLPGQSAPADEAPSSTSGSQPTQPQPQPVQPRNLEPGGPTKTHERESQAEPGQSNDRHERSGGLGAVPDLEPPQPEISGPAPEGAESSGGQRSTQRRSSVKGPGAVPQLGPSEIPGEADDDGERVRLRLPPPPRPPYSGIGLFVGASLTFAFALSEQIVAHVLVKRRCIDPIAAETFEDIEDSAVLGEVVARCVPGVVPAIALRVHSDIGLLATIGLAAGGAILRGRRQAHDDVFGDRPLRDFRGLRWGGVALIGLGVVTWFTTGAASWGILANCKSGECATRARVMNFTTRSTSAVLVASGAGMLGFAEAYRRGRDRFVRDRALSLSPAIAGQHFGMLLSGRF